MNVQNLQGNYPKLISYMENNGYSKTYVDRFKREITKILMLACRFKGLVQLYGCISGVYKNISFS